MQQCQGRLSIMFVYHSATNRIGKSSAPNTAPNTEGTVVPLLYATFFPFKERSCHGLAFLPCNCTPYQNIRGVLLTVELFTAMVCSRLSLSRLIWSANIEFPDTLRLLTFSSLSFHSSNKAHCLCMTVCFHFCHFFHFWPCLQMMPIFWISYFFPKSILIYQ